MKKSFWVPITLALVAYLTLPLPGLSAPLSKRIKEKRAQVEKVKRTKGVLTTTISRYNNRIEGLQGEIKSTQVRLGRVQRTLDEKRAELLRVRDQLEVARYRIERLRRDLGTGRDVLAERLVELYKADRPDALTVVLEADGFADLLERTEFLERISEQDREIVDRVRRLKNKAKRQAAELASLERRANFAAAEILRRRDEIAGAKEELLSSRDQLAAVRNDRRGALSRVRGREKNLLSEIAALEREQARVRAALSGAGQRAFSPGSGSPSAGPIKRGTGRFIWPVNGPLTGAFGEARPGHIHAGIDIAAPEGTPIRAADSGRVVLMGFVGGYGNYTCVQHTSSLSSCYAHQSRFATSNGASVSQGQVIGYVGNTGHSFGAHLHFEARVGGSPVSPLNYL